MLTTEVNDMKTDLEASIKAKQAQVQSEAERNEAIMEGVRKGVMRGCLGFSVGCGFAGVAMMVAAIGFCVWVVGRLKPDLF